MIQVSAAGRAGTPDEVGAVGALVIGSDGDVTAAYWYGELAPK